MNRIHSHTMARFGTLLIVCFMLISSSTECVNAASPVSNAKTAYSKALKAEKKAKANYNKAKKTWLSASVEYRKGSRGFYNFIIKKYSGDESNQLRVNDAEDALTILDKSSFKNYTKEGQETDATYLANMKKALALFPKLENKRNNDKNYSYLAPVVINNAHMARAQVKANVSCVTFDHATGDKCQIAISNENLAWGGDPIESWYSEVSNFNKLKAWVKKKYGMDYNSTAFKVYRYNMTEKQDKEYWDKYKSFGEMGHYGNMCCGNIIRDLRLSEKTGKYECVSETKVKHAVFGMAYSQNSSACYSMESDVLEEDYGNGSNTDDWASSLTGVTYTPVTEASYTVKEYTSLFNEYFNKVYPAKEAMAFENARAKYVTSKSNRKAKFNALKKKMATKVTVKVKKSKATIKWKKVVGVNQYQISVSTNKSKNKIVGTVKAKAKAQKKVNLKKGKKNYVKIRSVTTVNGKKVYGNWSKTRVVKG